MTRRPKDLTDMGTKVMAEDTCTKYIAELRLRVLKCWPFPDRLNKTKAHLVPLEAPVTWYLVHGGTRYHLKLDI
jgi:hypothetical protein